MGGEAGGRENHAKEVNRAPGGGAVSLVFNVMPIEGGLG